MANFLSLPGELRNTVYEQLLVLDEPIVCPTRPTPRDNPPRSQTALPELHTGILLANKVIHREASSILYAQNRFDFTKCTSEHISLFFIQIGGHNLRCIRHIYINFPGVRDLGQDNVVFDDDSAIILDMIQLNCTKLDSITTYPDGDQLNVVDGSLVTEKGLALIKTRFEAILSLRAVVIQAYENSLSAGVRDIIKSYGWTVEVIQREELHEENSEFDMDWFSWSVC